MQLHTAQARFALYVPKGDSIEELTCQANECGVTSAPLELERRYVISGRKLNSVEFEALKKARGLVDPNEWGRAGGNAELGSAVVAGLAARFVIRRRSADVTSVMKLALLGPIAWRTPPLHYGPWEQVTSLLAEGLVARGVDVTLFATLDSRTTATLDGVCRAGYAERPDVDGRIWEALHVSHALNRSAEFDLIHNHLDWLPLAFAQHCRAPLLTTIHGFSGRGTLPAYVNASTSSFVSISDADRAPELDYVATVHHGIDLDALPLSASAGDALVAFGRIHPHKGTADAIAIARRTGRRLIICGIIQDAAYFHEQVEPHVDGDRVSYLGSVGPERRAEILGHAAVLLHPIAFDEPFGLSVVEAMACGTPVIAYARGSMREIVDVGTTGFLVDDVSSAARMVDASAALDRTAIRKVAERRFGAARMVDDYLGVYRRVLARASTA